MSFERIGIAFIEAEVALRIDLGLCRHSWQAGIAGFLRGLRIAGLAYLSAIEDYLPLYINHDSHHSGFDGDLQAQVGHALESTLGRYKNRL